MGVREKIGKNPYQKGAKVNTINPVKTCPRRERPEAYVKIAALVIAVILYIPYLIIVLLNEIEKSFLRMLARITGKIREKL